MDASGKTLGRLATQLAIRLSGKHKADYTPHVDTGDHIIVINAEKIHVTGNKLKDKIYYRHTGAIGGIKSRSLDKLLEQHPERAIEFAVKGMLPEEPARPANVQEAARVRGRQASARRPAAEAARNLKPTERDRLMPANTNYGTGRRKSSTARVYMHPGTGKITSTAARSTNSSAARPRA